ncbi:MAG: hypothetical protein Q9221_008866 [Calogaya cf. arnoldii]
MDQPRILTAHLPFRFLKARQMSIEESETLCKQTFGGDVKNPPKISLPLWVLTSHPKKETQLKVVLQTIEQSTDNEYQTFSAAFDPTSSLYTFDAAWTQAVGPHVSPSDAVAFQHLPGPPRAFRAYVHHKGKHFEADQEAEAAKKEKARALVAQLFDRNPDDYDAQNDHSTFVAWDDKYPRSFHHIRLPLWGITFLDEHITTGDEGPDGRKLFRPILVVRDHDPSNQLGFRYYIPSDTFPEVVLFYLPEKVDKEDPELFTEQIERLEKIEVGNLPPAYEASKALTEKDGYITFEKSLAQLRAAK